MLIRYSAILGIAALTAAQQLYPFETQGRWSFVGFLNGRSPTFSDVTTGSVGVRLTESVNNQYGAAWLQTDRALTTNFAANFVFRIQGPSDQQPADGLCFALQTTGVTAGSTGEGLGLQGLQRSLAICFDTYPYRDESRTGVFTNGVVPQQDDANNFRMGVMLTTGIYYTVAVNYTTASGVISWTVSAAESGSTPAYYRFFSKNIGAIANTLGGSTTAWIGFTASTGGCVSKHEILLPRWAPICNTSLLQLPQQYPYNFTAIPGRIDAWRVGCVEGWTTAQTEIWQTFISNCSLSGRLPTCIPVTPSPSPSPSLTASGSTSPSMSRSTTMSPSRSGSASASPSLSSTASVTPSASESASLSATVSTTATPSSSASGSSSPSSSATPSSSASPSDTVSSSVTGSVTASTTASVSASVSRSVSRSRTPSRSVSASFDPLVEVPGGSSSSGSNGVIRRTALPSGAVPTGIPGEWVNSTNGTLIFVPGTGSGTGVDVAGYDAGGGGSGGSGGTTGDQNAAAAAAGLNAAPSSMDDGAVAGIVVAGLFLVGAAIAGTLLIKAKMGAGAASAAATAARRRDDAEKRRLRKLVSTPGVVRLNQGANGSERYFSRADAIRRQQRGGGGGGAGVVPASPAGATATPRGRTPAHLLNSLSFAAGAAKPGVLPGTSKLAMRPARPRGMPAGGGGVGGVDGEAFAAALDNPLLLLQRAPPMPPQLSSRSLTSSRSLVVPAASVRGLSPLPSKSPHPSAGPADAGFAPSASARNMLSASRMASKRSVGPGGSSRSMSAAAEAVQPEPAPFDPSMLPSDLSVLDPETRAAYEAYLSSPEYTAWWMANYGHLYDAAVAAQQAGEAAAAAATEPEPAAAAAPAGVINPFEGLSFPLDPTTAAFMGMDPETGQVLNIAAYYAFYAYVNGYDYSDAYRHYEAHFTSGGAAADVDVAKLSGVKRTGQRGGLPVADGLPPVKLVIGEGKVKSQVVVKGAVKLRRVGKIKGDDTFVTERKEITWEEVKERKEVEVDSQPRGKGGPGGAGGGAAGGAGGPIGSPTPGRLFSKSGRRL